MKKSELRDLLADLGVINKIYIGKEEITDENRSKIEETDGRYFIYEDDMTLYEKKIALLAIQTNHLRTIKNIMLFYFIISIIIVGFVFLSRSF